MIEKKIENSVKVRLDVYLVDELELTRSQIKKLLDDKLIQVNGVVKKATYKLKKNDIVTVDEKATNEEEIISENIPLDIVYEDDDLLVVNKPTNMVVHPAAGHYSGTLVNALMFYCQNKLSDVNGSIRPGIVHRIDKDTSGLLLVAKNNQSHNHLSDQLRNKTVTRVYTTLVAGVVSPDSGTIDAPIGRDVNDRKKQAVNFKNGKDAVTHFRVLERFEKATLLECKLETGRTHQIRVHLKKIGHPVMNDPVYSNRIVIKGFGQLLHAGVLGFIHPKTEKYMEFKAEIPNVFKKYLEEIRND